MHSSRSKVRDGSPLLNLIGTSTAIKYGRKDSAKILSYYSRLSHVDVEFGIDRIVSSGTV